MEDKRDQRNVRLLYRPPPHEDYSKNYLRLTIVIVIACIFIAVEIIGGTIANSIAIISDAIHLVSDLLGFIFSFLFLYLSKQPRDHTVSFGYHRMELIGALANIFIVWAMVLFIVF
jgi:zinc transporter 2